MPTIYKVLGQSIPAAATDATLYTTPSLTNGAVISTITVCNQAATATTFRIAIRVNGASLATSQYIAYDTSITANNTTALTLGVTLGTGDIITVRSASGNVSFAAFGSEIS